MNFLSAPGDVLAGRAHVVLHVARSQYAAWIHILKFGKHLLWRTPGQMNNDVQPPAMTHAHHQFDRAALACHVQNLIHCRQQRRVAFEGETFVAEIALLQRLLKQVGAHEQIERAVLVDCNRLRLDVAFDLLLDPAPPLRVGYVHELHAYAAAINAPRFPRPLVVDLEVGMRLRREQAQRVQFGLQISKLTEQPKHTLALVVFNDCRSRAPAGIAS